MLRWKAEEENARRLGARSNGILALITGLFGLAIVKIGSLEDLSPLAVYIVVRASLAIAVVLASFAVLRLLAPQKRDDERSMASVDLQWPDGLGPPFSGLSANEAREIAYLQTTDAVLTLQAANAEKQGGVDDAQVLLIGAGFAALIAIVCYLGWGGERSLPPLIEDARVGQAEKPMNMNR